MKRVFAALFCLLIFQGVQAQIGNLMKDKIKLGSKDKDSPKSQVPGPFCKESFPFSNSYGILPKGLSIYNKEHSDPSGLSGKYYTYWPMQFEYENSWGVMHFSVSEFTLEYDQTTQTAKVHIFDGLESFSDAFFRNQLNDLSYGIKEKFVEEAMKKGNVVILNGGGRMGPPCLNTTPQNPAFLHTVWISEKQSFMQKDCSIDEAKFQEYFIERFYKTRADGRINNIFVKDTNLFATVDSAFIVNFARTEVVSACKLINMGIAAKMSLPKRGQDNQKWIAELMPMIMEKGKQDGDGWTDKIVYAYFTTKDWLINYQDKSTKTTPRYRFQNVVVVTKGWSGGAPCKYINCNIKQDYNGNGYGPTYVDGFAGNHIQIDCDEAMKYQP